MSLRKRSAWDEPQPTGAHQISLKPFTQVKSRFFRLEGNRSGTVFGGYLGTVTVGQESYEMLFDTSLSGVWVLSNDCQACRQHRLEGDKLEYWCLPCKQESAGPYRPGNMSDCHGHNCTSAPCTNCPLEAFYRGKTLQGQPLEEEVLVAGRSLPLSMALVQRIAIKDHIQTGTWPYDGILGLAPPQPLAKSQRASSGFMDTFSWHYSNSSGQVSSTIVIGGYDPADCFDRKGCSWQTLEVADPNHWSVQVSHLDFVLSLGKRRALAKTGTTRLHKKVAVLDSGLLGIFLDNETFSKNILPKLLEKQCEFEPTCLDRGMFVCPDKLHGHLYVELVDGSGAETIISLSQDELFWRSSATGCRGTYTFMVGTTFAEGGVDNLWAFGESFLRVVSPILFSSSPMLSVSLNVRGKDLVRAGLMTPSGERMPLPSTSDHVRIIQVVVICVGIVFFFFFAICFLRHIVPKVGDLCLSVLLRQREAAAYSIASQDSVKRQVSNCQREALRRAEEALRLKKTARAFSAMSPISAVHP